MADDKMGPSQASMNAPMKPEVPGRFTIGKGADGRDAGQGAGVESGLAQKEAFATDERTVGQLGKPIRASGTPPWDSKVVMEPADRSPTDTFGAGQSHVIKNG